jgi:hypothetical protein
MWKRTLNHYTTAQSIHLGDSRVAPAVQQEAYDMTTVILGLDSHKPAAGPMDGCPVPCPHDRTLRECRCWNPRLVPPLVQNDET